MLANSPREILSSSRYDLERQQSEDFPVAHRTPDPPVASWPEYLLPRSSRASAERVLNPLATNKARQVRRLIRGARTGPPLLVRPPSSAPPAISLITHKFVPARTGKPALRRKASLPIPVPRLPLDTPAAGYKPIREPRAPP